MKTQVYFYSITKDEDFSIQESIFANCQQENGGAICIDIEVNVKIAYLIITDCKAIYRCGGIYIRYAGLDINAVCFINCIGNRGGDFTFWDTKHLKSQNIQSFNSSFLTHSAYFSGKKGKLYFKNANITNSIKQTEGNEEASNYGSGFTVGCLVYHEIDYITSFNCSEKYGVIGIDEPTITISMSHINLISNTADALIVFRESTNAFINIYNSVLIDNIISSLIYNPDITSLSLIECDYDFSPEFVETITTENCHFEEDISKYESITKDTYKCYLLLSDPKHKKTCDINKHSKFSLHSYMIYLLTTYS